MRTGFRIDANYVEDTVAVEIGSFLSIISFPNQRFSIELMSRSRERWLGADARLTDSLSGFLPFYMQFKRPSAYPDYSRSRIIQDRIQIKPNPLQISPRVLFFSLRNKKPNHRDYQHNILYRLRHRLRSKQLGDAAYVCPLFLDWQAYRNHLHKVALVPVIRSSPHKIINRTSLIIFSSPVSISLNDITILREHICIPPHKLVNSARHSYSFTENGDQVCFHSPEAIVEDVRLLNGWIEYLTSDLAQRQMITKENALESLHFLIKGEHPKELLDHPKEIFEEHDPIAAWMMWGDYLLNSYSIYQYAIYKWDA